MTTTATTTSASRQIGRITHRRHRVAIVAVIVAAGLAIVWTTRPSNVRSIEHSANTSAMTAGLSRELLAEELSAIRRSVDSGSVSVELPVESGLSRELLAEELSAIRRSVDSGSVSVELPVESGLSRELLAEELAAIHGD